MRKSDRGREILRVCVRNREEREKQRKGEREVEKAREGQRETDTEVTKKIKQNTLFILFLISLYPPPHPHPPTP